MLMYFFVIFFYQKELNPGEILGSEKFSLYDSMSATEISDLKTDLKASLENCDKI